MTDLTTSDDEIPDQVNTSNNILCIRLEPDLSAFADAITSAAKTSGMRVEINQCAHHFQIELSIISNGRISPSP